MARDSSACRLESCNAAASSETVSWSINCPFWKQQSIQSSNSPCLYASLAIGMRCNSTHHHNSWCTFVEPSIEKNREETMSYIRPHSVIKTLGCNVDTSVIDLELSLPWDPLSVSLCKADVFHEIEYIPGMRITQQLIPCFRCSIEYLHSTRRSYNSLLDLFIWFDVELLLLAA